MPTAKKIENVLPASMALTNSCHEDLRVLDSPRTSKSSIASFTISLDDEIISFIDDDDVSFLGEDLDDSSVGSFGEDQKEEDDELVASVVQMLLQQNVHADDLEISARTEISTDMAPSKTSAPRSVVIEKLAQRPARRGGRKPVKVSNKRLVAE